MGAAVPRGVSRQRSNSRWPVPARARARLRALAFSFRSDAHFNYGWAASKSSLSNPSCTIRIWSGAYSLASANVSSAEPVSKVSNSPPRVSSTGKRSAPSF